MQESHELLYEKSLPQDLGIEEANARMSLLNVTANSDETLTERRGDFHQNVPQNACASMPDLSRVGPNASTRTINRSGRATPVKPMSLREYDTQLAELKKENFNLKLKIYFLETKMPKIKSLAGEDVIKLNMDLQVTVEKQSLEIKNKDELLRRARESVMEMERRCEIEVRRDRDRNERLSQTQLNSKNEDISRLQRDYESCFAKLKERETEAAELRKVLDEERLKTEEKLTRSASENQVDSDSEGFSQISLLDDKERQILDLKAMVIEKNALLEQREKELEEGSSKAVIPGGVDGDVMLSPREHFSSGSILETSERTPRATEQTGIEAGSLYVPPEVEEMLANLEGQLKQKRSEVDELRQKLTDQQEQIEKNEGHEHCQAAIADLESRLQRSEEGTVKRDKSINGLLRVIERERKAAGQTTVGASTLISRAQAEAENATGGGVGKHWLAAGVTASRVSEQCAQTVTPDVIAESQLREEKSFLGPEPMTPRTQVADALEKATVDELREILDRIKTFMQKQNLGASGLKFGLERSLSGGESQSPLSGPNQIEVSDMDAASAGKAREVIYQEAIEEVVSAEDRLKVTEFVRVVATANHSDSSAQRQYPGQQSKPSLTPHVGKYPEFGGRPSMVAERSSAWWLMPGGLGADVSATGGAMSPAPGDLLNSSMNASADLGNLRRRVGDLRSVCERLYNKLTGSYKFLKKLLVQLGSEDLARQFEEEFGSLHFDLEESLNVTNAIIEDIKTAELSLSGFVSELEIASRHMSASCALMDRSQSEPPAESQGPPKETEADMAPNTTESGSNTDVKGTDLETLAQSSELQTENSRLHKTLGILRTELTGAQTSLARMRSDYEEAIKQLDSLQKLEEEKAEGKYSRTPQVDVSTATGVSGADVDSLERRCAKFETYSQCIKGRLEAMRNEFGLDLNLTPVNGSTPSHSGRYFDRIFDQLQAEMNKKSADWRKSVESLETAKREKEELSGLLGKIRKENEGAQQSLEQLKKKYEDSVQKLDELTLEYERLRKQLAKESRSVGTETSKTGRDWDKLEAKVKRSEEHLSAIESKTRRLTELTGVGEEDVSGQGATTNPLATMAARLELVAAKVKSKNSLQTGLKKDLEGREAVMDILKSSVAAGKRDIDQLRADITRVQGDLESAAKECEQWKQECEVVAKKRDVATKDRDKWRTECEQAAATCDRLREEHEATAKYRAERKSVAIRTDLGWDEIDRTEKRVDKYVQYIQIVKDRVAVFKEEIGMVEDPEAPSSPGRGRKIDKIFDDIRQFISRQRQRDREVCEGLRRECDSLRKEQTVKGEDLAEIIRQLNENNAKLEQRLREADSAIADAKENVPPSREAENNCQIKLKEIETLRQENNRLQEQLFRTMEMLTNTQERLTAKSSASEIAKDGIVRELSKIHAVLKQSNQDLGKYKGKRKHSK